MTVNASPNRYMPFYNFFLPILPLHSLSVHGDILEEGGSS
jgi:hypothetical protein